MNLNACEPSVKMGQEAGSRMPPPLKEEMGNAVEPNGMEPRIAEKDLRIVFGSRISLFNGSDIFLQTVPH
jgi:hypothetical protein